MRYGYCVNMIAEDCYGVGYTYIPLLKKWGFDYVDLPMAQLMEMDDSTFQDCVLAPLKDVGLPCGFPGEAAATSQRVFPQFVSQWSPLRLHPPASVRM